MLKRMVRDLILLVISVTVCLFFSVMQQKVIAADVPPAPVVIDTVSLGEFHRLVTIKLEAGGNSMLCFTVIPNPSEPACWTQAREMVVSTGTAIGDMIVVYSAVVDLAGRPDVLCMIEVVNGNNGGSSITCSATV